MKSLGPSCNALTIGAAAAMLASCGGSQPPIGAPGQIPQSHAIARHDRGGSWMLPEAASQDLLYVSDTTWVSVYSYPEGKLEGRLRHFYIAQGMCVDKHGYVYVTDLGLNKIFEYAHGSTKRLRKLTGYGGPVGCSIDPTTGDLAASGGVGVAIYSHAKGTPKIYQDPDFNEYFWCGYDNKGNLFEDGLNQADAFEFAELAKGRSMLKTVTLNQSMGWPGGVQWDGKHVAVGSYYPPPTGRPVIYQFTITGSQGTKVGTTPLRGLGSVDDVKQFWILNHTVVAPNGGSRYGGRGVAVFYNYPTGGKPIKKITKGVLSSQATVISVAPGR